MNKNRMLLVLVLLLAVLTGCGKSLKRQSDLSTKPLSFRDIPDVTDDEIKAIESLQKKYGFFVYGTNPSTEAFIGKDGEIQGYTVMFCNLLTDMFGIPFKPAFYEWNDLLKGLESGNVDFTGELMSTPERRKTYFMTGPVIQRSIKIYRLKDSVPLAEIIHSRTPRYAFLDVAILISDIAANTGYNFEPVIVNGHNTAYRMLKSGTIDAFFGRDTEEASFDIYGNMVSEDFLPFIFRPSCLSTRKEEFRPIISVAEKALDNRTFAGLIEWMHKSYDYRYKPAEARRSWLTGISIMFFFILVLVSFFLIKSRSAGKELETLEKRRTGELAYKTTQLQMMIDSIPDLMFCKDTNLRYTQCNKHFEDFIGVREADIIGRTDKDGSWLSSDSVENIFNTEQTVMNENRMIKFEEFVSSNITGNKSFFETVKAPLIQDGAVVGMMGIARDITRRKTMEKEIAYQTSLLKTMINSLPDGVFCKDVNFKYTLCNKYMADLFGIKPEDIIGKDDVTALGMSVESAAIANDADRRVIGEQRQVTFEEWLMCADGVNRLFETVKVPLIPDGEIVGILGIGRDITKRKAMEDEIQAASKAKTSFLANMSHEIRTPLNVIIGLTDLVLEDINLSPQISENLIKISNSGNTLLDIVNDILDFSKIESGKLELKPVEYYMSSLLNDTITLVITRLGEKPIAFRLNISDDLPAKLYGDDLRVKQIFTNLLSNAVKYTHSGSIELNIQCKREGDTMWLDITVKDTGIGIREEDLKKLFSDYNQVDVKANRNIEGTGLGLSITKRLAEMMDGVIRAESEYGKGTTFSLRIRQGFAGDTPIGREIADKLRSFHYTEDKRIANKRLVRLNLSYAKVLVVDDMQTNLDVAAGLLRKYKMQVDCLSSGQEAINRIQQGSTVYNAIFMDHMMPGMDGIEAAEAIRAVGTEYAQKVPIIALTANAIHGTEEMFFEHGFQAFLSKPIDVMEMDSILRKWVRDESQERVLPTDASSTPEILLEDENNKNIVINIPGIDTEKGLSLYDGETDIFVSLLHSYASNTPKILKKLREVSKETLHDYVITVHGLKGTSASIGAETIREAALNLENISRAGDLNGVLALNNKLINDTEIIVENIKAWLKQYDALHTKPRLKTPDRDVLASLRQSCENYDMNGIDKAMTKLESADYEEDADLVAWLKERIDISEIAEAAFRLAQYEKELNK